MARIAQKELFVWSDIEHSGDLERLELVLEALPDEPLMQRLERHRGPSGDDRYPIRPSWNSLLAGIIYGHPSIESLRRELKRNPLLRQYCGFSLLAGVEAVPTAGSYSRFLNNLCNCEEQLREIFCSLVDFCSENLEGFAETLAIDGKALPSYARRSGMRSGDRRGEHEANWGRHTHRSVSAKGSVQETVKKWFGFTLHLLVDTRYELPVEFSLTPASVNEMPVAHRLIDRLDRERKELLDRCRHLCADRGYDDGKLYRRLWDEQGIKPIIAIRRSWQDGEPTRGYERVPGVVYSNKGEVSCISPYFEEQKAMAPRGFEKDRQALKYRCPAAHYGMECKGRRFCEIPNQVRIPLHEDRRIFTPVARDSYKWRSLYAQRTAVERVNSRIDTMFGFEKHTIRGQQKMQVRLYLAFLMMLSFAAGKIRQQKYGELRQFLRAG